MIPEISGGIDPKPKIPIGAVTISNWIKAYPKQTKTIGQIINGISIIGFKITGKPKITGSLTLKIPQGNVNLPNDLYWLLFALKNIKITSPIVAPDPPKLAKSHNPIFKTCGIVFPAAIAAVLSPI